MSRLFAPSYVKPDCPETIFSSETVVDALFTA